MTMLRSKAKKFQLKSGSVARISIFGSVKQFCGRETLMPDPSYLPTQVDINDVFFFYNRTKK